MDLKEVFGVYGKPHRMFVQAMLTRGMVPSNELKKLFDLGAVHVIFEVFKLMSNIKIGVEPWMFIYFLLSCWGKFI